MTTKEKILEILLNSNDFVSGEELASLLDITRNGVWKAVTALRSDGFDIDAVTNRGYILKSECTGLSEAVIRRCLKSNKDRDIYVLDSVDSTNNYAKKLASEGALDGTLVTADIQTAGKGRMGRSFYSPSGNSIYMSVVLRPDTDLSTSQFITSCIAVAAADAVDSICGTDIKIKWVNDLFLGGKKICGILTEALIDFESGKLDFAVAGIGINIKSIKGVFPAELYDTATSIEDETGEIYGRNRLIAKILDNIDVYIRNMGDRKFLEEYRRRSFIVGKRVAVSKFNDERTAKAIGIADDAGLIVKYDDGTKEVLNSGEARIIM